MRANGSAFAGLALAVCFGPGCRKAPQVGLEVDLPPDTRDATKWVEIGVYGSTRCGSLGPMLAGGIPPEGTTARLAFDKTTSPPPLGDLTKANYAFAAVAKDENCKVLSTGCRDVDLTSSTSITIPLAAAANGAGECPGGSRCMQARCAPGVNNADPAFGADCSLTLVGAGPLGDPLLAGGGLVSAPAIAATSGGFLVGYREYDPFLGQARVTFISLDNGGGATAGPVTILPGRCKGSGESDPFSLAFSPDGTTGAAVVSRAACPNGSPGLDAFQVDPTGNVSQSGFTPANSAVALSAAHGLAFDPTSNRYIVAYTIDKQTSGGYLDERQLVPSSFEFGGGGTRTGAWLAATDKVRAFVAVGVGSAPPPDPDAGPPDAGPTTSTVRLFVLGPSDDTAALASQAPLDTFPGTWASTAVVGARVFVVSDAAGGGRQISYRVYEGSGMTTSDGILVEGSGRVAFADTAALEDRVFYAVEKAAPPTSSEIVLYAYTNATTTPTFKRSAVLSNDPRIPAMGGIRDGQVAVAASATRVAVTWTAGKTLTEKDAVGGYAMFACSR